jgi:hypothetical protein
MSFGIQRASAPIFLLALATAAPASAQAPRVGTPVPGLPNAVWADANHDGYVDGYLQYHAGTPPPKSAPAKPAPAQRIGGSVPGLAGALWADANNDGQIDGYVYRGQYYRGKP